MSVCEGSCETRANNPHSPTGSATSTTPSERQYYPQPSAQPTATYSTSTTTSEAYQNPDDSSYSSAPINARRQDSAIAHHRDTSKEGVSFAPPSESHFSYSHPSPQDSRHSTSPALSAYSLSHSSAVLPQNHITATSAKSHEHVSSPSAHVPSQTGPDPLFNNTTSSSSSQDHTTRQQRYNVRFAAVHTSANMPTTAAQRSRHSPPRATSTEPVDSPVVPQDDHAEPTIEPAVQALTRILKPSEESSQPDARGRQSSVERCPRCYEAWSKPLMPTSEWRQDSPAESTTDFARATDTLFARLRQYGRDTEEKYEQWKEKHSRCPSNDHRHSNSNPDSHLAASTETPHSKTSNGSSQGTDHLQPVSNKRKSEVPHGDTSKLRKVLFDANPTATPPPRPSAPI